MTISFFDVFSQKGQCGCAGRPTIPENQYTCDTTHFENGAQLYWQWNCDSAWLTFENTDKLILEACEDMDAYSCQRTGLNFLQEYPGYLLFQYKWISGCCTPPDLLFLSKETGKEIRRISSSLFVHGEIEDNYVLYFSDTTYTELIYLDNLTDKKYSIDFEPQQVSTSAIKNKVLDLTQLFQDFEFQGNIFTFQFRTEQGNWVRKGIEIK